MTTLPTRSAVAVEHTWSVEDVFASDADWEQAWQSLRDELVGLDRFQGHLGDGPDALADFLSASEAVQQRMGRLALYANMRMSVDSDDQQAAALSDRARSLGALVQAALAYAEPELLAVGAERLQAWAAADDRLRIYGHHFDRLARRAAHVRVGEVEQLLGLAAEPLQSAATIHGTLANAELRLADAVASDGTRHEVAQGTYNDLIGQPDRELRRSAWESYADAHLEVAKTMAACLAGGNRRDAFLARAHRYQDSLEAALTPNHVPVAVFHAVLDAFQRHLGTWHRYWRLRRRVLGLDPLREYDARAPLAEPVEVPFPRAVDLICAGLQPLGDDYVAALRRGVLEERWVDVYPNRGKRQGAFSTGAYGTHPFVFMSYGDSVFSLSTLAHELGHSMHRYLTDRAQPFVYSRYGLFLAEVASNFNQALVRAHLLASNQDPAFQVAVLEEAMGNFHRYFLVMPTLSRFELETHRRVERGEALTADAMTQLMADLLAEAYGGELEMDRRRSGIMWAQFSTHLYLNFYPYQYATGIAAAHALAAPVLAGDAEAAQRYRRFLSAGSSRYPLDALTQAGVDLTAPGPLDSAFGVLADYVDRLERLLT